MDRDAFLARIRAATGARPPVERPAHPAPPSSRETDTTLQDFADRWPKPHAYWHRVTVTGVAETITGIARDGNLRRIVLSADPLLETLRIPQALREWGVALSPWPETRDHLRREFAGADAGISVAAYAVGETGTLVERAHAGQPRSVSLLPPVHIALVPAEAVLASLDDLFGVLERTRNGGRLPSAVTLISGPSGTADIGLQHVTGAHGPREVHLIMIDDLTAQS